MSYYIRNIVSISVHVVFFYKFSIQKCNFKRSLIYKSIFTDLIKSHVIVC